MDNVVIYQNDHLGTPQKLTAINGAVVWSAKYSSFGEAEIDPSYAVENNLRFPGQYFDQETGLHYNYFRCYDPKVGRYLRKDPIGIEGGINLFLYSMNNPTNITDPLGLKSGWREFFNDPKIKNNPSIPSMTRDELMILYNAWEKEQQCKYGACVNVYLKDEFPGDEVIGIVIKTKANCDWDKLADCINYKIANTGLDSCAWCLKWALSKGQDAEAGVNCMAETAVGIGECYWKYCDVDTSQWGK